MSLRSARRFFIATALLIPAVTITIEPSFALGLLLYALAASAQILLWLITTSAAVRYGARKGITRYQSRQLTPGHMSAKDRNGVDQEQVYR